jgi:hypothetical protein
MNKRKRYAGCLHCRHFILGGGGEVHHLVLLLMQCVTKIYFQFLLRIEEFQESVANMANQFCDIENIEVQKLVE